MKSRLAGKVAVITGGALGIGAATARLFVREGAAVVLADVLENEGNSLATELRTAGGKAEFVCCDVTRLDDVRNLMSAAVSFFGKLDILFNNAGIGGPQADVANYPEDEFDKVIAVNLKGYFLGLKYAIPEMLKSGGGSIINNACILGLVGFPGTAAYAASKGAIIALTRVAALDYARQGIRVNAIAPGAVDTPMIQAGIAQLSPDVRDSAVQGWVEMHPVGRFARAEEVAPLVLFLASDESAMITGAIYVIDGGRTSQ